MTAVPQRREIQPGVRVQVIEKQNQKTGKLTEGIVARLLTGSPTHPHGIKVMLTNGLVGRVQAIVQPASGQSTQNTQKPDSTQDKSSPLKPA